MCDVTSNFKDLTKFGLNIREVDTSHFKLLFFFLISVRLSGPKLCPVKIQTFFMEKAGDPLIFAPSVVVIR